MKYGLILLLLTSLPFCSLQAQEPGKKAQSTFQPYFGLTYNHHIEPIYYRWDDYEFGDPDELTLQTGFPGMEFGFSWVMCQPWGLKLNYRNTLLGELLIREMAYAVQADKIGHRITDNTLSSGFFGRMEMVKQVWKNQKATVDAGLFISDRYASEYHFMITPGVSSILNIDLGKGHFLQFRGALSPSVNMPLPKDMQDTYAHQNYTFLLGDFDIRFQHRVGMYIGLGGTVLKPLRETHNRTTARKALSVGWQF